jgi:hypothetical protein
MCLQNVYAVAVEIEGHSASSFAEIIGTIGVLERATAKKKISRAFQLICDLQEHRLIS